MKKIVFFETRDERYGYMTIESAFSHAVGAEIVNTDYGTIIVIKEVDATKQNYVDAKALMSFCRRHGGLNDFKFNLERNW